MDAAGSSSSTPGLFALFFLIALIYSLIRSGRKWMTLVWAMIAIVLTVAVFAGVATIKPQAGSALGTLAGLTLFLTGGLAALEHSRQTRKPDVKSSSEAGHSVTRDETSKDVS